MRRPFQRGRKKRLDTIFIDRDGVINKDPAGWTEYSYVTEWKEFKFLPGVFQALKLLNKNGIKVIVISNQAGINKGYFTREDLDNVTSRMLDEINKNGGKIEEIYYCIHKKEDNCHCRKPKPGMLVSAIRKYNVDSRRTFFIGDSEVDVLAGKSLGIKTVFVRSGKTTVDEMRKWPVKPDYIFADLLETVQWVLQKEKRKTERAEKRREGVMKIEPPLGAEESTEEATEEAPEEAPEETDREE
jgi:D-glycero-D-manno-heptose 1,7-bisphosphate phosphatase